MHQPDRWPSLRALLADHLIGLLLVTLAALTALAACSRADPVKPPPARIVRLTSPTGQAELLLVPAGSLRGLVLFMHGVDSDEGQMLTNGGLVPVRDALLNAGFAIASTDAHGNNAGNPASVNDQLALYRDAVARLGAVPQVNVLGFSMGGLDALLTVAAQRVPGIGSVALLSPASDQLPFLDGRFGDTVRTAFRATPGDLVSAIRRSDPAYLPVSVLRGHAYAFWHSPKDTVVPLAQSQRMVTRLRAGGIAVTLHRLSGDHGNLSKLHPQDILQLFERGR